MSTQNLMEGLTSEISRVKELLLQYEAIPQGTFGATVLKQDIKLAEDAIKEEDIVKMITAYKLLKECE
jgi:hypothetical protein